VVNIASISISSIPPDALIAMVIERQLIDKFAPLLEDLGAGWALVPPMFPRMAYVVAVAGSRERMDRGVPLIYGCTRQPELRDIVELACQQCESPNLCWLLMVEDGAVRSDITQWLALQGPAAGRA
jgi:hypothetical protein